jgi:hypothetical protein
VILERGLRHGRHARLQQQLDHLEEDRQRAHGQVIADSTDEPGGGVHHAFLDLVPADRRAADRAGDLVGKHGLARARRPAHDNQGGSH